MKTETVQKDSTLDFPEDAAKDGFTVEWFVNGQKVTDETVVADGMIVVAVYTAIPVPAKEKSDNLAVTVTYKDGKAYYGIVALDGKAVPDGKLSIQYQYVKANGMPKTVLLDPITISSINAEFVSGSCTISNDNVRTITATFEYDGKTVVFDLYL